MIDDGGDTRLGLHMRFGPVCGIGAFRRPAGLLFQSDRGAQAFKTQGLVGPDIALQPAQASSRIVHVYGRLVARGALHDA